MSRVDYCWCLRHKHHRTKSGKMSKTRHLINGSRDRYDHLSPDVNNFRKRCGVPMLRRRQLRRITIKGTPIEEV